ncbi:MAG: lytic transglycosylase domain-containing protein [Alphaproteobacteria bacterium]|nr:lytic transglycosylase domain-containing protein [Alphaproteobacteria bacterium]
MHDRKANDRSLSHVPASTQNIGAFRRNRPSESYFGALFSEIAMLMLLIVATAGAIFAIQSPLGHGRYSLHAFPFAGQRETFTQAFSSALVRDKAWFNQQRAHLAYFQEQHMSFSQLMNRWQPAIEEASARFHVPASWIRAVMQMESGGRTMTTPDKPITSPVGAVGLMQLMPGTYDEMRQQYKLSPNAFDPHDNIMAGAAYLRWLRAKYGFPAMFVAYNDGPGNLEAHQGHGRVLPQETRNYISKICAMLGVAAGTATTASTGSTVKLTRPNGKPVWIDGSKVASIRRALPGEYARNVKTVITVGSRQQGVRETVAMAKASLRAHGASV